MNLQFQKTRLTDPLTGLRRPINENMTRQLDINLRHDIPSTQWAYGATFFQYPPVGRLPARPALPLPRHAGQPRRLVEHKDVFGLTVRASVDNLLGTNESFSRTFFDGRRNPTNSNILFTEDRDRFYGPVFTLTISGTI